LTPIHLLFAPIHFYAPFQECAKSEAERKAQLEKLKTEDPTKYYEEFEERREKWKAEHKKAEFS